jgi:hypothetical protein
MRRAPAQAAADAQFQHRQAGVVARGDEEIQGRHEDEHLRADGRRDGDEAVHG